MALIDRSLLQFWHRSQQRIEQTFEQVIERLSPWLPTHSPTTHVTLWIGDWGTLPLSNVEIQEFDRLLEIKIALPNVTAADLEIQVSPETVLIQADQTDTVDIAGYYRANFCTGRFQSLIPLPHRVYPDILKAELTDGVLLLQLARTGSVSREVFRFSMTHPWLPASSSDSSTGSSIDSPMASPTATAASSKSF